MNGEATLSSYDGYTVFRYGDYIIRFAAPYSLEKYISVKEWDVGYIVVMAKYRHNNKPEEEYMAFRCLVWVRHLKPTPKSYRIISMRL